ncbi:ABC transporter ATP-binding protein [Actinoplanes utahensis]|uniref:ABC transporter ATP-binding protein n=1 Tax=Actinoplanes utahensis TaxID=1869 RepID=UPI000690F3A3|nr:ABC transporter ATP-binding protein [Actinoplanes utahensis]GIF28862.1 ABC transporter permease [Actinoplanes utahensis]
MKGWFRLLQHVTVLTLRAGARPTVLAAGLLLALSAVVAATGLSQRWLVDSAGIGRIAGVVAAVAVGAAAHGLAAAAGRVQSNITLYLTGRVQISLNEEVQARVAGVPGLAHVEQPAHLDRLSRLRMSLGSMAGLPWAVLAGSSTVLSVLFSVLLLASVDPWLCLLAVLALPVMIANRRAERALRVTRDECAQLLRQERRLHELCTLPGPAKEVMLAGSGEELQNRARKLWDEAAAREARTQMRSAVLQVAGWALFAVALAGTVLWVAGHAARGRASLGDVVLVISLATHLQVQLRAMLDSVSTVAEAGQAVGHYWWLREYERENRRPGLPVPTRMRDGIRLRGVSFRYPGADADALHGIDLFLPAGGTIAVVGVNGAGKSTLVKLLAGMYAPTAGEIAVDGTPLPAFDTAAWQVGLSAVFQDFARLQLLLRESIGTGDVARIRDRTAVTAAVELADAQAVVESCPDRLDTVLGAMFGGVELSAGEWQKVALARSLMRQAPHSRRGAPLCVLLDEPSSALDPVAEQEMFRHMIGQVRTATAERAVTVLVSHRFSTVRMADVIVVLDQGRVTETGSHEDLMAAGSRYAELYRLQAHAYRD